MSTGKLLSRFCRILLPRSSGSSSQKDPEDKDTAIFRNVSNYHSAWPNITGELNLQQHGSENLKVSSVCVLEFLNCDDFTAL